MNKDKGCYCSSQQTFQDCCQPLLQGVKHALTAEQLMRSRYSAFATGQIDYLIYTLHPSKRHIDDRINLAESIQHCQWISLHIASSRNGQENDEQGEVSFYASYLQQGKAGVLQEKSHFIKEGGRWYYLDGEHTGAKR